MKISVNKDAKEKLMEDAVNDIINIAKKKAEQGIDRFYYSTEHLVGVCKITLTRLVEEKTEDSVYVGYRGLKSGEIKFSIRD